MIRPEFDNAIYLKMNKIQEEIYCTAIFTREIESQKVEEVSETTAWLFKHAKSITITTPLRQKWNVFAKHSVLNEAFSANS